VREVSVSGRGCVCVRDGFVCDMWEVCGVCV